jgi:hypothetical protein
LAAFRPPEALLPQARQLQASPAFDEAQRQHQMVEHRIARLVQLGIRRARHFGRTKTLFQVCLAAAVANLTLLAATSSALSVSGSEALGWSMMIFAVMLSQSSLLLGLGPAALVIRHSAHLDQLIHPMVPMVRSPTPPSRPGF